MDQLIERSISQLNSESERLFAMPIPYVIVKGRLGITAGDTLADADDEPDIIPCTSGIVRFSPLSKFSRALATSTIPGAPMLLGNSSIDCTISLTGDILYKGAPFVKLINFMDPGFNPHYTDADEATYHVEFIDVRAADGSKVDFQPFNFAPQPGVENELSTMAPTYAFTTSGFLVAPNDKGLPNGTAPLDGNAQIPLEYLPDSLDTGPADWNTLTNKPLYVASGETLSAVQSDLQIPTQPSDIGAATAAQGAKADTALQPGSVTPANIGAATAAQGAKADSAVQPAALTSKADLVGGVIPDAQLPPLALQDTFVVATQAAMLALTAQKGDLAVRTDVNKSFRLATSPATTLANWIEIPAAGAVTSVAGKTGTVSLVPSDVGAATAAQGAKADTAVQPAGLTKSAVGLANVDNTSDANKPLSTAAQTALNSKADKSTTVKLVLWNKATHAWPAYSTDPNDIRDFRSLNDVNATAPTYYNDNDDWLRHPDATV